MLSNSLRFLNVLALAVTLLACAGAPIETVDRSGIPGYRLGAGDRVRIDVFNESDLTTEAVLDSAGYINYPLLGRILATNLTVRELEAKILIGLASGYLKQPNVRVIVTAYRPFYAIGEVRKSGALPYIEGLTVEKALALAGGVTELASKRRIYILRETSTDGRREKVTLETLVLPGDTLIVEEGLF